MIYATAISDGVHNLMTMESSPPAARMRQAVTKLRAVPSLLASARVNIRQPSRVFVERAAVMFRGVADLLDKDLHLAFADAADEALRRELRAAADGARRAVEQYAAELETTVLAAATGNYAVGTANVEARYRAEELIDAPAATLLAIGDRELRKKPGRIRRRRGARIDPGRPALDVWRDVLNNHPKRGEAGRRGADDRRRAAGVRPRRGASRSAPGEPSSSRRAGRTTSASPRCTPRRRSRPHPVRASSTSPTPIPDGRRRDRTRGCRNSTSRRSPSSPRTRSRRDTTCTACSCGRHRARSADLDRSQSVSAAFLRSGRLGALRRATRVRPRLQG